MSVNGAARAAENEKVKSTQQTLSTAAWLALDTETTGLNVEADRIISLALVGPTNSVSWLINPGMPIPAKATAIHGISTEQVRANGTAPREALAEALAQIESHCEGGGVIVAYNAAYDLTLLDRDARRAGLLPLSARCVIHVADPLVLDRALDPERAGRRNLAAVSAHYGVELVGAHGAAADARAAMGVLAALVERYQSLSDMRLESLGDQQALWESQWAEERGYRVYESWPVRENSPTRASYIGL